MQKNIKKTAFVFLIFLGIISFFSDFTHEGARSIYGQYLGLIGVSAFLISLTAGLGEFLGQALRIVTGAIADRTKKYWTMMILGYAINLLAIPLLAFVDNSIWQVALVLILLERVGKAIRAPAKSTLTSFTANHLGAGKAFAINEALDQLGAFLGPLMVFAIISSSNRDELTNYQISFGFLGILAICALVLLFIAKAKYPNPENFEQKGLIKEGIRGNKLFILYMISISFIAFGFIDYPLIAYHFGNTTSINVIYVPLLYSIAMGVDALSALFFGYLFDKKGVIVLAIAIGIASLSAPLIFIKDDTILMISGVIIWGIGMGAQESILKAVVSKIIPKEKRATGYGIFSSVFGLAWFLGSLIVGALYDFSLIALVIFSVLMELVALVLIIVFVQKEKQLSSEKVNI
ncbi:MAG: MFS transporter [Bacilli bacterium]|nr:MFS transporter [Bacilli bacterium]